MFIFKIITCMFLSQKNQVERFASSVIFYSTFVLTCSYIRKPFGYYCFQASTHFEQNKLKNNINRKLN